MYMYIYIYLYNLTDLVQTYKILSMKILSNQNPLSTFGNMSIIINYTYKKYVEVQNNAYVKKLYFQLDFS